MSKTSEWNKARAKLKAIFERADITRCEICNGNFALSFAHRYKRRFIHTNEELMTVALLCQQCHHDLEYGGHQRMYDEITRIIESRNKFHLVDVVATQQYS